MYVTDIQQHLRKVLFNYAYYVDTDKATVFLCSPEVWNDEIVIWGKVHVNDLLKLRRCESIKPYIHKLPEKIIKKYSKLYPEK